MNTNLKAKWLAALRSGKYQQGKYTFKSGHGTYCCLGVLCEVLERRDLICLGRDDYPGLREASGLTSDQTSELTSRNDSNTSPHTFEMIADYIEAHITSID